MKNINEINSHTIQSVLAQADAVNNQAATITANQISDQILEQAAHRKNAIFQTKITEAVSEALQLIAEDATNTANALIGASQSAVVNRMIETEQEFQPMSLPEIQLNIETGNVQNALQAARDEQVNMRLIPSQDELENHFA